MGIIKTIMAFFQFHGEKIQMELRSARIYKGVAYLHPIDDDKTFAVKSDRISIMLDNNDNEDSVRVIEPYSEEEKKAEDIDRKERQQKGAKEHTKTTSREAQSDDLDFTKKTFATGFYEFERREIVTAYKSFGAKRDEYLLACVRAAAPGRVKAELRKIRSERDAYAGYVEEKAAGE